MMMLSLGSLFLNTVLFGLKNLTLLINEVQGHDKQVQKEQGLRSRASRKMLKKELKVEK
jgi:hypothetical protein